jgi:hypothetical protein
LRPHEGTLHTVALAPITLHTLSELLKPDIAEWQWVLMRHTVWRFQLVAIALISLLVAIEFLPVASADVSGPYMVDAGSNFSIQLNIAGGNLYCAYVTLSVPAGFWVSTTRFSVPSWGLRTSIQARAPNFATSGTFQATLFYWPNVNCAGTSYVSYAGSWTVIVQQRQKFPVSFAVGSSTRVVYAWLFIYDSRGNQVGSGAGYTSCSGCVTVHITIDLPTGCYTAKGGGYIQVPGNPGGTKVAVAFPTQFCVPTYGSVQVILSFLP